MRYLSSISLALVVLMALACGGGPNNVVGNPYPQKAAEVYLEACVFEANMALSEKDAKKYCSCTLQEFEREYSLKEFLKQLKFNPLPAKVVEIIGACNSTLE